MATVLPCQRRNQRGQAMVELVIVAVFVLLPLFLAMPLIGKYLDVRTAAAESARYAAWERTVWYGGAAASSIGITIPATMLTPSFTFGGNSWQANAKADDEIRNEIAVRLLSNTRNADAFKSGDKGAAGFTNGSRDLWRTRDGSPMLASYDDVTDSIDNADAPGLLNKVVKPVGILAAAFGPFTLETGAQYEAKVSITLRHHDLQRFLDAAPAANPLTFTETNVILANGWGAGGADSSSYTSVMSQVKGLTPTSLFDAELPIIGMTLEDIIHWTVGIPFPEIHKLDLGKIEPDIVPEDRLK